MATTWHHMSRCNAGEADGSTAARQYAVERLCVYATRHVEAGTCRSERAAATAPQAPAPVAAPANSSPPIPSLVILLVDDEPSITRGLARLLRRDGHTVDTAANGRQALEKLQERAYDLILSDLRMPELDGPGLYHSLAPQHVHLRRRFIFLTGDALSPELHDFLARSGVPLLTKPYLIQTLRHIIWQTVEK